MTQDEEELWAFENLGGGEFRGHMLWMTDNYDLGSAGLVAADLDSDGDDDLILPAGDNLEDLDAYPQPYHGCYWFENQGDWTFKFARISDLGGTYAADVDDFDLDGDQDVVLISMTNDWYDERHASVVWLENDGQQRFQTWQIDSQPIHLIAVESGDLDGDGRPDIVAGSLNFRKPYQRVGRVTAWMNFSGEGRMNSLSRILMIVAAIELVGSGWMISSHRGGYDPVLPKMESIDDPLLVADIQELADQAANSESSSDWRKLGEALLGNGFYSEAEWNFRRAIELDEQNIAAQFGLAFVLDRDRTH